MRDLSRFGLQAFYFDQDEFGPHTHDFIEAVYVVSGHADHLFMGRRYPIIPGDFFIINTHEMHGYAAINELRIVNILITRHFLSGHRSLLSTLQGFSALFTLEPLFRAETSFRYKLHLLTDTRMKIEPAIDALVTESARQADGYEVVCTALFLQIVALASRAFASRDLPPMHHDFRGTENAVARAIAFLESRFDKEIAIDEVADSVCMSPSRLRHVFKEAIGLSLMEYLLRCRLERAREIIRNEDRSISQIAFSAGFHDPAYFSRAYRKLFGHSPRQEAAA